MNVDYQVLTFKNKIKARDIDGLGVELDQRKGSGNYDKERTQYNKEYVGLDNHPTLLSKVMKLSIQGIFISIKETILIF